MPRPFAPRAPCFTARALRFTLYVLLFALTACLPDNSITLWGATPEVIPSPPSAWTATPTPFQPLWPTPTVTAPPSSVWIAPYAPAALQQAARAWGLPLLADPNSAALHLEAVSPQSPSPQATDSQAAWIYALVTPFSTTLDGVTADYLRRGWAGVQSEPFAGRPLLMDESTLAVFTPMWGAPAVGAVQVVPSDQLLDQAWAGQPSWALLPFEALEPRWKVLAIDGQSPIRKEFDPAGYPLVVTFRLQCDIPCPLATLPPFPATNRDPSKMTTLVMTGVTALVRATAQKMETRGVVYPGRDIRDWLRQADIAHISNEIPFFEGCPLPNPNQPGLVFCSDPKYIGLLEDVGADVVELTGNHFHDYGEAAMLYTLKMYTERSLSYYGGGADLEEARRPLMLEHNGNELAFIGCNPVDPLNILADENRPGAAPCDFDYLVAQIRQLRAQGYLPIATFQHYESYAPTPTTEQARDFRMMADAGALIVSGSQAHYAQMMEFYNGAFIHYGLGNLFFDQMDIPVKGTRREFLDRHVFYDGRYISAELLTAMLEDFARPRPMTSSERLDFLTYIFAASGWGQDVKTPSPTPAQSRH